MSTAVPSLSHPERHSKDPGQSSVPARQMGNLRRQSPLSHLHPEARLSRVFGLLQRLMGKDGLLRPRTVAFSSETSLRSVLTPNIGADAPAMCMCLQTRSWSADLKGRALAHHPSEDHRPTQWLGPGAPATVAANPPPSDCFPWNLSVFISHSSPGHLGCCHCTGFTWHSKE